jgi:hypothetical protein
LSQNAKVGILVTFARQLKEKLNVEQHLMRTSGKIKIIKIKKAPLAKL